MKVVAGKQKKSLTGLAFLVFYPMFQGLNERKQNAARWLGHLTLRAQKGLQVLHGYLIKFCFKTSLIT